MDNQTVIAHADLYVRNLFVNITEYPVVGQGTSDGVQYSDEVSTAGAGSNVVIFLYQSETNYPNTVGHIIRVHYDINFELKAANSSADLIWKLQARNKNGTWQDMCTERTVSNIGTSYVEKTIKGYLDLDAGITKIPFELRLILQSNEGVSKSVDTWTATAAYTSSTIWNCFAKFSVKPTRVYGGVAIPMHNYRVVAWYNEATNTWTACNQVSGPQAVVECRCMLEWNGRLYIGTDQTISSTTDVSWSQVYNDPKDLYALCLHTYSSTEKMYAASGNGGKIWVGTGSAEGNWQECAAQPSGVTTPYTLIDFDSRLFVGTTPNGNVFYTLDGGATWTETGDLPSATHVYSFAILNGSLYAGTEPNGKIFKFDGGTPGTWSLVATLTSATKVKALASFDSRIYAGTDPNGDIFYSSDGDNWTASGNLAGATTIKAIVKIDTTAYPLRVYAGINGDNPFYGVLVSGEGTGKVKNDTVISIVGRIV